MSRAPTAARSRSLARDRAGARIEQLIRREDWTAAQAAIEQQLAQEPQDHWLWARLSGVQHERRHYQDALKAAEKALKIVPDCPLALWSKAVAQEMLGHTRGARDLYRRLFLRGLEQIQHPDADAEECWEGEDWTCGLMADCFFRVAGCMAELGPREPAVEMYQRFLALPDDLRIPSILRWTPLSRPKSCHPSLHW